ncbi:putative protein phosphatase 2C 35 [Nymphaea thermarum]|nr:putative protein phosphatase 2C 35 [Nymphaea thermarum]
MGCVNGKCCRDYPESSDWERGVLVYDRNGERVIYQKNAQRLTECSVEVIHIPSHDFRLKYSFYTQKGYYPDSPDRENQDSFCIKTQLGGDPNFHFFGVFDGHGQFGARCAKFVRDHLVECLVNNPDFLDDPVKAYNSAFSATNSLLRASDIDDSMSGTTAITVFVKGNTLFVANVGDSRAVLGVRRGSSVVAEDLSLDQTPFRKDEYERVKLCGARVLSVDQIEGIKDPNVQSWGDEESDDGDPPRLWMPNAMYPGTAFTRSLGDSMAEKIGVISVPEVKVVHLNQDHMFFVIASDGVFEFLSSQAVVDMVSAFKDPRDACAAIATESYRLWLDHESRTDDITIIIVRINGLHIPGANDGENGSYIKPTMQNGQRNW